MGSGGGDKHCCRHLGGHHRVVDTVGGSRLVGDADGGGLHH